MRKLRGRWVVTLLIASLCVFGLTRAEARPKPIPIYIFAGQSNMVGAAARAVEVPAVAPTLAVPEQHLLFWGPTTDVPRKWTPLEPPTEILQSIFRNGFGPEVSAARRLAKLHPKSDIAVFKYARNASGLYRDWNPRRRTSLYRSMIDRLNDARAQLQKNKKAPTRIAGFFWMQGESDADTRAHANAYGANLKRFIAALRHDLRAPKLPVVIGQIDDVKKLYPTLLPYSGIVRAQQAKIARADPRVFMVRTERYEHDFLSPIHLDAAGTVGLGDAFVRSNYGL